MRPATNRARFAVSAAGFTLIEIMVVIMILGMLFAVVGTDILKGKDEADDRIAGMDAARIYEAVEHYMIKQRRIPDWDELLHRDENGRRYIKNLAGPKKDPWGNPYIITTHPDFPREPFVYSFGPNQQDDGGQGDDITSLNAGG